MGKLSLADIVRLTEPGLYSDGDGLYLQVTGPNSKSWIYRYTLRGRARALGLGSARDVSPVIARTKRDKARVLVKEGIDVVEDRRQQKIRERAATRRLCIFKDYAIDFISARRTSWRNAKHAAQWDRTLAEYVYPLFGSRPIDQVNTADILSALRPIWPDKPETASRIRGRIESILDAAKAEGLRERENPARWRGHLNHLLPGRNKVKKVKHHPSMHYTELPAFFGKLCKEVGSSARALQFTILTIARTTEALGATWAEIDLKDRVWNIPADRMKSGRQPGGATAQR